MTPMLRVQSQPGLGWTVDAGHGHLRLPDPATVVAADRHRNVRPAQDAAADAAELAVTGSETGARASDWLRWHGETSSTNTGRLRACAVRLVMPRACVLH